MKSPRVVPPNWVEAGPLTWHNNVHGVKYLLVGGYAVCFHSQPCATRRSGIAYFTNSRTKSIGVAMEYPELLATRMTKVLDPPVSTNGTYWLITPIIVKIVSHYSPYVRHGGRTPL